MQAPATPPAPSTPRTGAVADRLPSFFAADRRPLGAGGVVPMVPPPGHRHLDPRPMVLPAVGRGHQALDAARFAIALGAAISFALACAGLAVLLWEAGR